MAPTIVIGGSPDERETCVADGWKHVYLDYGNHLVVRKQFYYAVKEMFGEINNCDLTFSWDEILDKSEFAVKVDEIERLYKIYPA